MKATDAPGQTDYKEVSKRLGYDMLKRRVLKQASIWAKDSHQGKGLFKFEHIIPLDRCITLALKVSGLYDKGVRNYLDIQTIYNDVFLNNLPKAFDGFKILQLSDLHCDLHEKFTPTLISRLKGLTYDFAVFTGDYHSNINEECHSSLNSMREIIDAIPTEKVGILGNHDFIEKVSFLEAAGLPMLLNENTVIRKDNSEIWIGGIDDQSFFATGDIERSNQDIPKNSCKILLSHSPEAYVEAQAFGYNFMLSGHTHGGQICLPGGKIIEKNTDTPMEFIAGSWSYKTLQGYTSRGTGACGVPIRFNCPAEVTIHTLRA